MRQVFINTIKTGEIINDKKLFVYQVLIRILDNDNEVFNSISEIKSEYCKNVTDLIIIGQALNKYFEKERFGEIYTDNQVVFSVIKTGLPITYDDDGHTVYHFKCFANKDTWYLKAHSLLKKTFTSLKFDGQLKKHWRDKNK